MIPKSLPHFMQFAKGIHSFSHARTLTTTNTNWITNRINSVRMNCILGFNMGKPLGCGGEFKARLGDVRITNDLNEYKNISVAFRISLASMERPPFFMTLLGKCFELINQMNKENIRLILENEYNYLQNEIDLVANFKDSPYIVQYIVSEPIVSTQGEIIGVVELAQSSLDKMLTKEMDFSKLLKFLADASEGLAAMHAKGFIHSDIKPENILVSLDESTGLLSDFGATTKIGEKSKGGTLHYMKDNRDSKNNTVDKDLIALALTTKDLIDLPGFLDMHNPKHVDLKNEIYQVIGGQWNKETQLPAKEFAQKIREFSLKAQELGCQPLGDKDLNVLLRQSQNKRAGVAGSGGPFIG